MRSLKIEKIRGMNPAEFYSGIASTYDNSFADEMHFAEDCVVRGLLQELYRPGLCILDVGCGTGNAIKFLSLSEDQEERSCLSWFYRGTDPSLKMINEARRQHPGYEFSLMNANGVFALPAGTGRVDLLVSTYGSLSYAKDPTKMAAEIARVVSPKGGIFLMLFGRRYARRRSYIANRCRVQLAETLYTARGVRELLGPCFEDVEVRGFNSLDENLFSWSPRAFQSAVLRMELKTLGRWLPDVGYTLIVTATRR